MKRIVFYYKTDCHLCDAMEIALRQFMLDLNSKDIPEIVMRDIEDSPKWYKKYREYAPVLVVDGQEICHYFFDQEALMASISGKHNKSD